MKEILWVLLEVGVNLYQGLLLSHYVYTILRDKKDKAFIKSGGMISAIILATNITTINYLLNFNIEGLYLVTYIGIIFVYSLICLKGSILKKLFLSSFSVILISIITGLVTNFFGVIFDGPINEFLSQQGVERLVTIVVCQLIILYVFKVTSGIFKKDNKNDLKAHEWILILSVLIISIVIAWLLTLMATKEIPHIARVMIVLSILGVIIINIVTVYLVVNLIRKSNAFQENQMLKMQQMYQEQYIENAQAQYETIRKLRHEYKNHNLVIASMLDNGKIEKARRYLNDNINQIEISGIYVNTNNYVLNAVINSKAEKAKGYNIKTTVFIVSDFTGIDDFDLCSLISNMFDNAIEACRKTEKEREIDFAIKKEEIGYMFSMKNTIEGSVIKDNPTLITTKKNKEFHGLGTKIIREIAKKYNGIVDFYEEDDRFIYNVLLK